MSQKEEIKFYSVGAPYGEFSCFAVYPIRVKGKIWPTTEHYFQAQKFAGTSQELAIQKAATPMKAAELGRTKKIRVRPTWDNVKDNIMLEAMRAKFSQHAELKTLLLATEDANLVEHTETDAYWGDGGDGKGLNKLGKILMKVREELQKG
ncbi:MAG TPA: NADAR family protein [Bacteroidia bacterium]|nr:NADAR family protein [Bacteroidia bacterium]